jgi:hypothetical protein
MSRFTVLVGSLCVLATAAPAQRAPKFQRVFPLKAEEGVFAYSRISPDGRYLAYASEMPDPERRGRITQTITVVDLQDRKVLFTEPGIDAYFSPDGERMIYLSYADRGSNVSIRHHASGKITRNVAPVGLGDYFSWAMHDGKHLILTIQSNYYYLDGDKAVLPHGRVASCLGIGTGDRPLISRDGQRVTTFVRGTVVVRSLADCGFVFDTGIRGAKADFSWDGRHVAFHAPKATGRGYDINVVDIERRTMRNVTASLAGSSLFPSWTRDGRLSFRYDGDDYRGFMTASDVLSAPAKPLPTASQQVPASREWSDIFPETRRQSPSLSLVLVWGTWSAHAPAALADLERARAHFAREGVDVSVVMATEPGSLESDVRSMLSRHRIDLPRIPLAPERLALTEAHNQNPTTLLFRDGALVDRRMGAQTFEQLRDWIAAQDRDR